MPSSDALRKIDTGVSRWSMLPCVGYSRLSVDRYGNKDGYEIQEGDGNGWAARAGEVIGHWHRDKNETAADEDVYREGFEQMLAEVAAGQWKAIVVWRIDRLTRLIGVFERVLRTCNKAGAYIYSVNEGLDSRNENDLTQMRLKVIMGEHEVQGTRKRIAANKGKNAKAGKYTGGGRRPFGFAGPVHDDEGRVINSGIVGVAHVAHEADLLRDAARRVAWDGESYMDVIRDWHSRGIYGATGSPWSIQTLKRLLTSPRMVGKQAYRDRDTGETVLVTAEWEPILDEPTWKRLSSKVRTMAVPHNPREKYVLTNIALCGRCEKPLTGSQRTYLRNGKQAEAARCYRCHSGAAYKERGHCGKLNALADDVEAVVVGQVIARIKRTRGMMKAAFSESQETVYARLDDLEQKKAECTRQLEELAQAYRQRLITMDEWVNVKRGVEDEAEQYESQMKALATKLDVPSPTGDDWGDLAAWYRGLSFRQKTVLISAHVERVVVLPPGRSGRYFRADRVVVTLAGAKKAHGEGE